MSSGFLGGTAPFLFWPRGGRKRRVGFWTWDCGWLMAINSISHLSSLPHYWVVAGLSWWVLPCCCEAGLLEEGASGLCFARSELGLRVDVVPDPVGAGESEKSPRARRIEVLHDQLACCLIGFWPRCPFRHCAGEFPGRGRREESTPRRAGPNSPWGRNTSPGKARRGLD